MNILALFPNGKWEHNENDLAIYLNSNDLQSIKSIRQLIIAREYFVWSRKSDNSHQFIDNAIIILNRDIVDLCILPKKYFKISFQIDWLIINLRLKIDQTQLDRFFLLFEGNPLIVNKSVIIKPLVNLTKILMKNVKTPCEIMDNIHSWDNFQTYFTQDLEMNLKESLSKMGLILVDTELLFDECFENNRTIVQSNPLDPNLDYFVQINSTGYFCNPAIPLDHEYFFIGRSKNKNQIAQEVKNLSMACYSFANFIVLPQNKKKKSLSPTAYLHKSGNCIQISPSWLNVAGNEIVYLNQKKMSTNSNSSLKGFETIQFCEEPPVKFLYIPSLQRITNLTPEIEQLMEKNQQWLYLGYYWKSQKHYFLALKNFEIAKTFINDPNLKQTVDKEIRYLSSLNLIEKNIENQQQNPEFPNGWLEISYFSKKYGGNIIKVEEEIQLFLKVVNHYKDQKIKRINLHWKCDQVGNFNWRFYDLNPRESNTRSFPKKVVPLNAGNYPVKINGYVKLEDYLDEFKFEFEGRIIVKPNKYTLQGDVGLIKIETNDMANLPEIDMGENNQIGAFIVRLKS